MSIVAVKPLPVLSERLRARFWQKIEKAGPDDCWLWRGTLSPKGYGIFARKGYRAHRISFFISTGTDPLGKLICHRCDNPPCVNPAHLFMGTDLDNLTDMAAKGRARNCAMLHPEMMARGERNGRNLHRERYPIGEAHPDAKLTEAQVREILKKGAARIPRRALALEYGCTLFNIEAILYRRTWKHLRVA